MSLRRLGSHADLLRASEDDPFVRYDIPASFAGPGWAWGDAVVALRATHTRRLGLLALGSREDLGELMAAVAAEDGLRGLPLRHATVQRDSLAAVSAHLPLGDGNDWEWLCTHRPPPPVAAESVLEQLGPRHEPEIRDLLAGANPRTDARPFEHPDQHWVGVRDDAGMLVACGVREPSLSGHPLLSGITVRPEARGTGLGLAVTAGLTRAAVEEAGVATLGMYSDNDVARRVYHGLGYGEDHLWSSRRLIVDADLS